MRNQKLRDFLHANSNRKLLSTRGWIESFFDQEEVNHDEELKNLKQSSDKKIADLNSELKSTITTLKNSYDERIALNVKVQMLERQLQEKQEMLDRFLPAKKEVNYYCNNCHTEQRFTT